MTLKHFGEFYFLLYTSTRLRRPWLRQGCLACGAARFARERFAPRATPMGKNKKRGIIIVLLSNRYNFLFFVGGDTSSSSSLLPMILYRSSFILSISFFWFSLSAFLIVFLHFLIQFFPPKTHRRILPPKTPPKTHRRRLRPKTPA